MANKTPGQIRAEQDAERLAERNATRDERDAGSAHGTASVDTADHVDERLSADRIDRDHSERDAQERELTHDRDLTEQERVEMLQMQNWQEALPNLPPRSGYHRCWLTTTNPRDTVQARLRLGYSLLRTVTIPGFEQYSSTGAYDGVIGVNEMVAAEIPLSLYEKFMKNVHHDQPNNEERRLNAVLEDIRDKAERARLHLSTEEGTEQMGKEVRRPTFESL